MNGEVEIIDLAEMRILREFPVEYGNDEETAVPHLSNTESCIIGELKDLVILATKTRGNPELSFHVAFDRQNREFVAAELRNVVQNPTEGEVENTVTEKGKDKLLIGIRNNFPHNVLAPIVRIFIKNLRPVASKGQNLDQKYWDLSLPPKGAERLAEELESLNTEQEI